MKKQKVAQYNSIVLRTCFSFFAKRCTNSSRQWAESEGKTGMLRSAFPACGRPAPMPSEGFSEAAACRGGALGRGACCAESRADFGRFMLFLDLFSAMCQNHHSPGLSLGALLLGGPRDHHFFQSDRSVMLMQHKKGLRMACAAFALQTPPSSSAEGNPRKGVVLAGVCEPVCSPALVRDPS